MKQVTKFLISYKAFVAMFILSLMQVMAYAQETGSGSGSTTSGGGSSSSSSTTTTTTTETWYAQPWVWIVGGAVLLLLIVALTRGGSRSAGTTGSHTDRVTVTKSRSTDTDV